MGEKRASEIIESKIRSHFSAERRQAQVPWPRWRINVARRGPLVYAGFELELEEAGALAGEGKEEKDDC